MSLRLEGITVTRPHNPEREPEARVPRLSSEPPSEFERQLRALGAAVDRGEALLDRAGRAQFQDMDAGTLIALQAGIYRYSEAVNLLSKFVNRIASGARTIVQAGH